MQKWYSNSSQYLHSQSSKDIPQLCKPSKTDKILKTLVEQAEESRFIAIAIDNSTSNSDFYDPEILMSSGNHKSYNSTIN
jgi:hypothetical protein